MLRATPVRIFSSTFSIRECESELEVAQLRMSSLFEDGAALIEGREMRLSREGLLSGPFLLQAGDTVIARAHKPSVFRDRFLIDVDDVQVELERAGLATRSFELRRGEDVIGTVERGSLFSRSAIIQLDDTWPLALQVFVFWLVLIIWKRMDRA